MWTSSLCRTSSNVPLRPNRLVMMMVMMMLFNRRCIFELMILIFGVCVIKRLGAHRTWVTFEAADAATIFEGKKMLLRTSRESMQVVLCLTLLSIDKIYPLFIHHCLRRRTETCTCVRPDACAMTSSWSDRSLDSGIRMESIRRNNDEIWGGRSGCGQFMVRRTKV